MDEIERTKQVVLEKYKADEMKRMTEEREKLRKEREARELELERSKQLALREPEDGLLNQFKRQTNLMNKSVEHLSSARV